MPHQPAAPPSPRFTNRRQRCQPPGAWGCEIAAGGGTKYVNKIDTSAAGKISVTTQGFGDAAIDAKVLTLTPFADATFAAAPAVGAAVGAWRCGNIGDGTSIPPKYLPGSCK